MHMLDKPKYAAREIAENYDDLYWWRMRATSRIVAPVQQQVYDDEGIDVMSKDWDSLLVVDAARADIFEEVADLSRYDEYRPVRSKGSASPEWVRQNFEGEEFGDTVYVSANPWVSKIAPGAFHAVENLWQRDVDAPISEIEMEDESGFNMDAIVPAEEMNREVEATREEYPNKRVIVHYFQPHAPYIGNPDGSRKDDPDHIHPGRPLAHGEASHEEVWSAYRENLEYVLVHARDLAEQLPGKTVITSDHGELFGEWLRPFPLRGYTHPEGLRQPELLDVPWAVVGGDNRPDITDDGVRTDRAIGGDVNERLRDLGYKP